MLQLPNTPLPPPQYRLGGPCQCHLDISLKIGCASNPLWPSALLGSGRSRICYSHIPTEITLEPYVGLRGFAELLGARNQRHHRSSLYVHGQNGSGHSNGAPNPTRLAAGPPACKGKAVSGGARWQAKSRGTRDLLTFIPRGRHSVHAQSRSLLLGPDQMRRSRDGRTAGFTVMVMRLSFQLQL
jgi:hypothetical protein